MSKTILLIDDEIHIRRFIRISLVAEGFQYLEAENARDGLALAFSSQPDLIVLDLGLPDIDGFWCLQQLRQHQKTPVLILTARDAEDEKVRLLEAGANDYLSKPFGIRELIVRIKVLLRDLSHAHEPEILEVGDIRIDRQNHLAWHCQKQLQLSKKEFALLLVLTEHAEQLITQASLLRRIWGDSHVEDGHYLRILVSQLRKKLNDDANHPLYIVTEPGIGYRFFPQKSQRN